MIEADWIKMRVRIKKDPKTIGMADFLLDQPAYVSWLCRPIFAIFRDLIPQNVTRDVTRDVTTVTSDVTSDVTRDVTVAQRVALRDALRDATVAHCVTGLIEVWGTAREQGRREEEDLILEHCTLETIAAIAEIPLFGHAMASVEWAVGDHAGCVIFPKFFNDKDSPQEKTRSKAAARQARYREKLKALEAPEGKKKALKKQPSSVTRDVTRDVTRVTRDALEERRGEEREKKETHTTTAHTAPEAPPGNTDHELKPQWLPEDPGRSAGLDGIEIGNELVFYTGDRSDYIRWEAEFIRRWNSLKGVIPYEHSQLSHRLQSKLLILLRDPAWRWKAAFELAPYWLPNGKKCGLTWFFEDDTVEKILDGRYERPEKPATESKRPTGPVIFAEEPE